VNPQNVRNAEFKTVRKGLDPEEVNQFLAEVADSLEKAQNQATAMEARARAAVQRAQELAAAQPDDAETPDEPPMAIPDEAETISRALLLAQRTADAAIAEAESEAESVRASAAEEATKELDAARELAMQMSETAKVDAEKLFAGEKEAISGEILELKQNRDLLAADVDALDSFLAAQRERIRDAASTLVDLTERVPGGLAEMAAPVLDSRANDDTAEMPAPPDDVAHPDEADEAPADEAPADQSPAEAGAPEPVETADAGGPPDEEIVDAGPEVPSAPQSSADDSTQVLDAVDLADEIAADPADATPVGSPDDLAIVSDLEEQTGEAPDGRPRPKDNLRLNFTDEW